jgi:predicted PhzF superfamily epimerase YddE/YHI9
LLNRGRDQVSFASRSGPLVVRREGERLSMDFPAWPASPCDLPPAVEAGLGKRPREILRATDYLAVFDSEEEVRSLAPRLDSFRELDARGVIATAPGRESDFVSRFFAPAAGVDEDPVTGSAHCTLVPYWSARLGRNHLKALQVSARGGELWCEQRGDRVILAGKAVLFLEGAIRI